MHRNNNLSINIADFYGMQLSVSTQIELTDDYYIENAKAEINIRFGQSKFRNGVR